MVAEILAFNKSIENTEHKEVCELLYVEIVKVLGSDTCKIWHAIPVWFVKENPVVGYNLTANKGVNLLFWSGHAFSEPGLTPEGSFKAAEIKYQNVSDIDIEKLRKWLEEAKVKIYNYKDIRKNRGTLSLI